VDEDEELVRGPRARGGDNRGVRDGVRTEVRMGRCRTRATEGTGCGERGQWKSRGKGRRGEIPALPLGERRGRPLLVTLAPFLPFLRETFALP
jgi:hypothetical protein